MKQQLSVAFDVDDTNAFFLMFGIRRLVQFTQGFLNKENEKNQPYKKICLTEVILRLIHILLCGVYLIVIDSYNNIEVSSQIDYMYLHIRTKNATARIHTCILTRARLI